MDTRRLRRTPLDYAVAAGALVAVAVGAWAVVSRPWDPRPWHETERSAWVPVWVTEAPQPEPDPGIGLPDPVDGAEWSAMVDAVRRVDPDAFVTVTVPVLLADRNGSISLLAALDGPLPAGELAAGREPGPGEVVVSATRADESGWGIGDELALSDPGRGAAPRASLTVVGLTPDAAGYVSWADARDLIVAYGHPYGPTGMTPDGTSVIADFALYWEGGIPPEVDGYVIEP